MSKITLPPLPKPQIAYGYAWKVPIAKHDYFTAEQLQADRIMVAEHVIRACAQVCEQMDDESYPHTRKWPSDCAAAILALLPPK